MQSQIVCSGCRNVLFYPRGATNVCCAMCSALTSVPPAVEMAQLICGGCRTWLMYPHGATSVRCSCCQTINVARPAHVNCGQCHTTLMYPYGAPSVKCAVCNYVTNVGRQSGATPALQTPSTSAPQSHGQTVVVENPMTMDKSGKLVSNVVVGVTTDKK